MNKHSLWTELNLNWNSGALFNVQPSHAEQLLGILKKGEARGGELKMEVFTFWSGGVLKERGGF